MTSPEALKAQIDSTEALQSVVKTMKALAAVSIHQYETAIAALHHYTHTIELGLQILLQQPAFQPAGPLVPDGDGPLGLVVFGSDQGLCGQFNPQITEHLAPICRIWGCNGPHRRRTGPIGWRWWGTPGALVQALGLEVDAVLPVPRSVYEITGAVQELLLLIEGWRLGWRQSRSGDPRSTAFCCSTINP
jgi:F-type H+-transporting ATPase subunit gamma